MSKRVTLFYSYLNLESTKTNQQRWTSKRQFYSYLNLESTKTNQNGREFIY